MMIEYQLYSEASDNLFKLSNKLIDFAESYSGVFDKALRVHKKALERNNRRFLAWKKTWGEAK